MTDPAADGRAALAHRLSEAGFVAADEEADELIDRAGGQSELLDALVGRRLTGEPLAWITGKVSFCGIEIRVDPGIYVPRWQSEPLARRAVERLPVEGTAVDVCCGSGAIAKVLMVHRPRATVVATEVDERAVACAVGNGVVVYRGDLFAPLPPDLLGHVDVVVGVPPYVPRPALALLPRDTLAFETTLSYDGGVDGTDILRKIVSEGAGLLRPGGGLLVELGGDQAETLEDDLVELGYTDVTVFTDEDGDIRGLEATLGHR